MNNTVKKILIGLIPVFTAGLSFLGGLAVDHLSKEQKELENRDQIRRIMEEISKEKK